MALNFDKIDSINSANNALYSRLASEFSSIVSLKKPIYDVNNKNVKTKFLNYSKKRRMWFSRIIDSDNFIYFFGYNYGENNFKAIKPLLILEFDKDGEYNEKSSGLFLKEDNDYSVVINSNYLKLHPIKKSIKTINSTQKVEYNNKEFYYLGRINDDDFIDNINRLCEELESTDPKLNQKDRFKIKSNIENKIAKRPKPRKNCIICGESTELENIYINSNVLEIRKNHMDKCINCINKIITLSAYYQIKKEYGNSFDVNDLRERFTDPEFVSYILDLFIKYQLSIKMRNNYILSSPKPEFKMYEDYLMDNILIEKENYSGKINKTYTPTIEIDKLTNKIENENHVIIDDVKRPTPHARVKKPLKYIDGRTHKKSKRRRRDSRKANTYDKRKTITSKDTIKTNTHDKRKTITSKDVLKSKKNKENNLKRCRVCGDRLPESSRDNKCKSCKKKYNAIKSIIKLLDIISINDKFKVDDLNLRPIECKSIIWNLEDFDLIDQLENEEYKLKDRDTLKSFIEKYGEGDFNLPDLNIKKTSSKICKLCNQNLPLSKFSKSRKTDDGLNEYCKDCHKKIRASKYLIELLKFKSIDEEFKKDSIDSEFGSKIIAQSKLDTLVENDLVLFNSKEDTYKFNEYDIIYEFHKENAIFEEDYKKGLKDLENLKNETEVKPSKKKKQTIKIKPSKVERYTDDLTIEKTDKAYLIKGKCSEDKFYRIINKIKKENNHIKELELKSYNNKLKISILVENEIDL